MCDCRPESVAESNTVKENPRSRARLYLPKLSRDRADRVVINRGLKRPIHLIQIIAARASGGPGGPLNGLSNAEK